MLSPRPVLVRSAVPLGIAASIGMYLVLIMGATVTNTGSAQGCARDWPLCRGQFIPEFTVQTFIEFSHRAVAALESALILAFAAVVIALWRQRRGAMVLVAVMIASLLLQAGMGAAAVKWPQQPVVLALHFGISLIALASTVLTAVYAGSPNRSPSDDPKALRVAAWGSLAYVYLLVYTGAYVSHAGDASACATWPVCSSSGASGWATFFDLLHRAAALGAVVFAALLFWLARRERAARPEASVAAGAFLGTLLLQAAAGAALVLTHFDLLSELLHAAVTGLVFVADAYLCFVLTRGRLQAQASRSIAALTPEGAGPGALGSG